MQIWGMTLGLPLDYQVFDLYRVCMFQVRIMFQQISNDAVSRLQTLIVAIEQGASQRRKDGISY